MAVLSAGGAIAPERLDRPFQDPLVRRLFPPLATGVHWGLERTERALAALGDPHRGYACLHVGGTNGKGSVTCTLASVLHRAGHRTGAYTSPHLCSFRERIMIDGRPLSERALLSYAEEVGPVVVGCGLTFFEAVTVLALHVFAREGVGMAVLEVGLGGRLDATNVVRPEVAAVTNVARDHAEFLGDTLEEIAAEKGGIIKPDVPFVTAEPSGPSLDVLTRIARARRAPMTRVEPDAVTDVRVTSHWTDLRVETASWGALQLRTPLVGHHQALNAALAARVLDRMPEASRPARDEVVQGIASVEYHGRDEILEVEGVTWVLDVAHNTAGMLSLADTIDRLEFPEPRVALVGVLGDKDWAAMLPPVLSRVRAGVLIQPPTAPPERRWDPEKAQREAPDPTMLIVEPDFEKAFRAVRRRAAGGTAVVTGSVHTVGGALRLLGREPLRRFDP